MRSLHISPLAIVFIILETAAFAAFSYIDVFTNASSIYIKYSAVLLCVLFAAAITCKFFICFLKNKNSGTRRFCSTLLLFLSLVFTALADLFLLVLGKNFELGVMFFYMRATSARSKNIFAFARESSYNFAKKKHGFLCGRKNNRFCRGVFDNLSLFRKRRYRSACGRIFLPAATQFCRIVLPFFSRPQVYFARRGIFAFYFLRRLRRTFQPFFGYAGNAAKKLIRGGNIRNVVFLFAVANAYCPFLRFFLIFRLICVVCFYTKTRLYVDYRHTGGFIFLI